MKYFIIGGTGSLGRKLIERLLKDSANKVCVYSRDEAKHYTIRNELARHPQIKNLTFAVGDIRDKQRLRNAIIREDPNSIIIAAALKQVDTCELTPDESIKTNLIGTQNVIEVIDELEHAHHKGMKVLFVSTDKACAPVNVYGMCKAISERLITSMAMAHTGQFAPIWLAVRYGNVLESRGSIIPLFKHQGMHGEFLTVTDPEMTRFLMTLDDSVDLIVHALSVGKSGETWVPRLPAMKIDDLAKIFAKKYDKDIKVIGLRPGEKQHEDLINESEGVRTNVTSDQKHFIIAPAYQTGTREGGVPAYSSGQDVMSRKELEEHLNKLGIIEAPLSQFKGAGIEEIVTNRKE